jgi:hypothetical protein
MRLSSSSALGSSSPILAYIQIALMDTNFFPFSTLGVPVEA